MLLLYNHLEKCQQTYFSYLSLNNILTRRLLCAGLCPVKKIFIQEMGVCVYLEG